MYDIFFYNDRHWMVRTCFMKLNEPRKVSQTKNARTNDLALYELMIF